MKRHCVAVVAVMCGLGVSASNGFAADTRNKPPTRTELYGWERASLIDEVTKMYAELGEIRVRLPIEMQWGNPATHAELAARYAELTDLIHEFNSTLASQPMQNATPMDAQHLADSGRVSEPAPSRSAIALEKVEWSGPRGTKVIEGNLPAPGHTEPMPVNQRPGRGATEPMAEPSPPVVRVTEPTTPTQPMPTWPGGHPTLPDGPLPPPSTAPPMTAIDQIGAAWMAVQLFGGQPDSQAEAFRRDMRRRILERQIYEAGHPQIARTGVAVQAASLPGLERSDGHGQSSDHQSSSGGGGGRDDGDGGSSHGTRSDQGGGSEDGGDQQKSQEPSSQCLVTRDDDGASTTCWSRDAKDEGGNPNPEDASSESSTVGQRVVAGLMAGGQVKVHVNVSDTVLGATVSGGRDEHWNPGEQTGVVPTLAMPAPPKSDQPNVDAGLVLAAHAVAAQAAAGAHGPSVTNDDRMPPPDDTDPGNPNSTQAAGLDHLTPNTTIHP